MLKPHGFRRSVVLPNMQRAVDTIWEIPSDHRPAHGAQAWAAIRVSWSPVLRQMVPTVMRLFTRKTGENREVMGASVTLHTFALPAGGPEDTHAESEVEARVRQVIPTLITGDPIVARIFPATDVLHHQ